MGHVVGREIALQIGCQCLWHLIDVGLVPHDHELASFAAPLHVGHLVGRGEGVDDPQYDGSLRDLLIGPFDAEALHGVVSLAYSGRIDEPECDAVDFCGVLDDIACGAVDVADDGTVLMEESVEQCRFSYVRPADDGYGDSFLHCLSGWGAAVRDRRSPGRAV